MSQRARQDGFTLIEMIVALAILSVALGVLFAAFSQDMAQQRLNRSQNAARIFAQSLLDRAGIDMPLRLGTTRGATDGGLAWSLTVAPYGSAEDRKAWAFAPAQVTAHVEWRSEGEARGLSLTTLKPLAGEAPP